MAKKVEIPLAVAQSSNAMFYEVQYQRQSDTQWTLLSPSPTAPLPEKDFDGETSGYFTLPNLPEGEAWNFRFRMFCNDGGVGDYVTTTFTT